MEIRFGAPLITRDGAHVGAIQRIVLASETQRLRALTVRIGRVFAHERVLSARYLRDDTSGRSVVVDLDPADVAVLPLLRSADLSDSSGNRDHVHPYVAWTGGETSVTRFVAGTGEVNRQLPSSFDVPHADGDVRLLDAHTMVHGSNGKRLGCVAGVVCDDFGTAIGLLIKKHGIFRGREMYVPTDLAIYSGALKGTVRLEWQE
jgi:sporulation protein YlmC with PRC-barrel domain